VRCCPRGNPSWCPRAEAERKGEERGGGRREEKREEEEVRKRLRGRRSGEVEREETIYTSSSKVRRRMEKMVLTWR